MYTEENFLELDQKLRDLERAHDRTPSESYAVKKRVEARRLCLKFGIPIPEWAEIQERGHVAAAQLAYEDATSLRQVPRLKNHCIEAAAMFRSREQEFQVNVEYDLQQWYRKHVIGVPEGASLEEEDAAYSRLTEFVRKFLPWPQFDTLETWAVIVKLLKVLADRGDATLEETPPDPSRSRYLNNTRVRPDWGRKSGSVVVLADDWTIEPGKYRYSDRVEE